MERNLRVQAFKISVKDLGNCLKSALPFIGLFGFHTYFNISLGMDNAAATLWKIATSQQIVLYYWTPMFALFALVWYVFYYRAAVYSIKQGTGDKDNKTGGDDG